MNRVSLDHINRADKPAFVAALGDIFEQAPWVAEVAFARKPFATLSALHEAMIGVANGAAREKQDALIKGHPDLAGKAARVGSLTTDSKAEQASAGLDRLTEAEYSAFQRLNEAYRSKFRIPFIVCVRRHTKDSILRQFEMRLKNDMAKEHATAMTEISRIAALRLDQRVEASDRLKVNGRLSTHVLDTHSGRPAAGVSIELLEISDSGGAALIAHAATNADGRTGEPLIGERPIPIGRYEIRFGLGDYFARQNVVPTNPPFLDVVPVRFGVAEAEGHYHVPLLATPWSYATYRGS
jgi:2-oxo-4-hydroxy-4-carboxy-5-ureidoimidazoline decarboxylase